MQDLTRDVHVIHANRLHNFLKPNSVQKVIKEFAIRLVMLEKEIDPPVDFWPEDRDETLDWLDDLARETEEDEAAALHSFECRIYNELERRYG